VFQSHRTIQLRKTTEAGVNSNFIDTQPVLVLPGVYRVDLAILDTNTGEHATIAKRRYRTRTFAVRCVAPI
jgi:hypothetical protein